MSDETKPFDIYYGSRYSPELPYLLNSELEDWMSYMDVYCNS